VADRLTFPSLRSQPFWEIEKISQILSDSFGEIREEVDQVLRTHSHLNHLSAPSFDSIDKSIRNGQWKVCYFIEEGDVQQEFTQLFPKTTEVLRSLPLCCCCLGYSYLSILSPGAEITPHAGATNTKLRIQLPLLNTEESVITVHGREYKYQEGKPLIFDDSFVHSVRNFSSINSRVVLLIDIWHPDLTPEMISDLSQLYPSPKSSPSPLESSIKVSHHSLNFAEEHPLTIPVRLDPRSTEVATPPPKAYDFLFKLLLIGETDAGKSSFITRFVDNSFSTS
jgi:hypothetical protein